MDPQYYLVRPGETPRLVEDTEPTHQHRRRLIVHQKKLVWIFAIVMDCATGELLPVREGIDLLTQAFL